MRDDQGRGFGGGRSAHPDRDDTEEREGGGLSTGNWSSGRSVSRGSSSREDASLPRSQSDRGASSGGPLAGHLSGRSAAVETDHVSATLLALPSVEIQDLVYDYQLDGSLDASATRPLVMFDVENTGTEPLRWQPSRTRFIGDDDYTYQTASLSLDPDQFGPGCHTRQVTIEPGRRAKVVTLIEELPDGVTIEEAIYRCHSRGSVGSERLRFELG